MSARSACSRSFGIITLTSLLALIALWVESAHRATLNLERGERHEREGSLLIALDRYQQAARSYAPLISAPQRARAHLERLAEMGIERGAEGRALAIGALARLRGAAWATEGLMDPYQAQRDAWDQRLAALLAEQDQEESTRLGEPERALVTLKDLHLRALRHDLRPPPHWSASLGLGLLLNLIGVIGLIWGGLDDRLHAQPTLWRWALLSVVGSALWITALASMPG